MKNTIVNIKTFYIIGGLLAITVMGSIAYTIGLKRGLEASKRPDYEYQITLEDDSIYVENNGRYVGSVPCGNSAIDSLFIKDNE